MNRFKKWIFSLKIRMWMFIAVWVYLIFRYIIPDRVEDPGVMAPGVPAQFEVASHESFVLNDYTLTPLANFEMTAKVLAKKRYRTDPVDDLTPYDSAPGWGRMSDAFVLENIRISQSGR